MSKRFFWATLIDYILGHLPHIDESLELTATLIINQIARV